MKKYFHNSCVFFILFFSSTVLAQEPKYINAHKDWYVFTIKQKNIKVCFLTSSAIKSEGDYTKRGDVLFVVTQRSGEKEQAVINFRTGYKFKKNTDVIITIDNKKFNLFTNGSDGWAKDNKTDNEIVKAMIRGSQMLIEGTSSRGTETTDTFSLSGFTAAYETANKTCKA